MKPMDVMNTMRTMLDINAEDEARLKAMGPLLTPYAEDLAKAFYAALDKVPEAKNILDAEGDRRARLHDTLKQWYEEIFSGEYGDAYANRRWIIGLVHVRVGIPPKFVVASIENVYQFSARKLGELSDQLGNSLEENIHSLSKMLRTDLAFIEQSYAQSTSRAMANEIGANEALFKRFASNGANELLEEARQGKF